MTFAWQGFCIQHPDEWSPITLTGDRKAGYVKIASPHRLALQIRWATGKEGDARRTLQQYLDRIAQDAKKAKSDFSRDISEVDGRFEYTYRGPYHGRGVVMNSKEKRTFFIEIVGGRGDSILSQFRSILSTFIDNSGDSVETWALYGLKAHLPGGLKVERKSLKSGHTRIELRGRGAFYAVERWGFAEQLIARHGLESWGRAVLKWQRATVTLDELGPHYINRPLIPLYREEALVRHQPEQNQLIVLSAKYKKETSKPSWDWLA